MGGYLPDRDVPNKLTFIPRLVTSSLMSGKWLVVDELNRADIDKAFGELFTLFAGEKVELPVQDDTGKPIVLVPPGTAIDESAEHAITQQPDWRMIGTMNTFDKASLFQLSYAFMRRFAFVEVPVPKQEDFESILASRATSLSEEEGFRSSALGYLQGLFCAEEEGLGALGLRVGAAIPLDIIEFLVERQAMAVAQNVPIDVRMMLLEGLEMYLFPQFEGRGTEHEGIAETVANILGLPDAERDRMDCSLAIWTGYERRPLEEL
jgi:hypothetical protein